MPAAFHPGFWRATRTASTVRQTMANQMANAPASRRRCEKASMLFADPLWATGNRHRICYLPELRRKEEAARESVGSGYSKQTK